jgi:hypothetical protein
VTEVVDARTIIMKPGGMGLDFAETAKLWTERWRKMTPAEREADTIDVARQVNRMDPTGRLRWLVDLGPDGYELERRETCPPCLEHDHVACKGLDGLMFRIPIGEGTFICRCHLREHIYPVANG